MLKIVVVRPVSCKFSWRQNSHMFSTWSGLAFEKLCLNHEEQVRAALGVSGVSAKDEEDIERRVSALRRETGTDKQVIVTLITTKGLVRN